MMICSKCGYMFEVSCAKEGLGYDFLIYCDNLKCDNRYKVKKVK